MRTSGSTTRPLPGAPATVCAIAITYYPDIPGFVALLEAIRPQVTHLVVVDNGSPASVQQALQASMQSADTETRYPAPELILNADNAGIAAAQNQGLAIAKTLDATHVLLLDQDSLPDRNMVANLLQALADADDPARVAALGPMIVETKMTKSAYFVRLGLPGYQRIPVSADDGPVVADVLIASGCLMPMKAVDSIGLMDETLFIDRVDTEWCLRASASGFVCLGVPAARLAHSIGSHSLKIGLLGREVSLHSPLRHYYAFRNSVLMMKRSYIPWRWRLNEALLLAQMFAVYLGFAPQRPERFTKIMLGLWHGLRGRSGPLGQ